MYIVQFTKYNNVQCTGCLNHVQLRCTLRDCKYNFKLTYIQNNSQPETPETRVIMQSLNKYNISNIFNNLCQCFSAFFSNIYICIYFIYSKIARYQATILPSRTEGGGLN